MSLLKTKFIFLTFLLCFSPLKAQTITGNLEQYISTYIDGIPGSTGNDFQTPASIELITWRTVIDAILINDLVTARNTAASINYQIVEYSDTQSSELHYVLEEKSPLQHYWGLYVFNPNPCRNTLILQAPHPKYDFNTGKEAGYCYTRLSSLALFVSGTHRCNQSGFSVCDGTTSICQGTSSSFQVSDNAHTIQSVFQETTDAINDFLSDAVFVQLHGFSKQASDPYVIMSNGTRDTPTNDFVDLIKTQLFAADAMLTFEVAHVNLAWTRLIAFSNTQGRLVNQSFDPCNTHLDISMGKFVHIEQEKTKLRDDSTGWFKMYTALANVFPCDSSTANYIESKKDAIVVFPNPVIGDIVTAKGKKLIGYSLLDMNGKVLKRDSFDQCSALNIDISGISHGIYLMEIRTAQKIKTIKLLFQ